MATYIILFYGQYFLETAQTTAAPRVGMKFWRNTKRYECIDGDISDTFVRSVHRQMFYLTEELVMLALCDKHTSNEEKKELIDALLKQERPQHFVPQKPLFKVYLLLNKHDESRLSDFVGSRSWLVFDLFDVDVMWMQFSSGEWSDNLEFLRFEKLLHGIICVNDVAERNVKNICDYAEYSKDSERRDRAVIVANYRREFVDFSKMFKAELSNF